MLTRVEVSSSPAAVAEEYCGERCQCRLPKWFLKYQKGTLTVGVLGLVRNLLAEEFYAGCGISTSSLGIERLAIVRAEPLSQRLPGGLDVVGDALAVGVSDQYDI